MIGIVRISPQAAADAFGTIAAHLRGNYRVQVLTLAGLAAYVDGDGAAAGIALEAASAIGVDPSLRRCSRCSTRPARPESSPRRSPTLPPSASRWRARWESNSTPNSRTDKTAAPTQLERVGPPRTWWWLLGHRALTTTAPHCAHRRPGRVLRRSVEEIVRISRSRKSDVDTRSLRNRDSGQTFDDRNEIRVGDFLRVLRCLVHRGLDCGPFHRGVLVIHGCAFRCV